MKNEKLETAVTIEKFGVSRNVWRFGVLAAFALLAVCGLFFSLTKGALEIDLAQICAILQNPGADAPSQIIWNIRMPRTIVGALVGVNLALAGAILQAIMRNPLADPHIIGISSGAGLAGGDGDDFISNLRIFNYAGSFYRGHAGGSVYLYFSVEKWD
ncbi:MAG: iron chelate uptake ABC transporter family permease subunit [Acidaminococcaceae bacterium]